MGRGRVRNTPSKPNITAEVLEELIIQAMGVSEPRLFLNEGCHIEKRENIALIVDARGMPLTGLIYTKTSRVVIIPAEQAQRFDFKTIDHLTQNHDVDIVELTLTFFSDNLWQDMEQYNVDMTEPDSIDKCKKKFRATLLKCFNEMMDRNDI